MQQATGERRVLRAYARLAMFHLNLPADAPAVSRVP